MSESTNTAAPGRTVFLTLPVPAKHVDAVAQFAANLIEQDSAEVEGFMFDDVLGMRKQLVGSRGSAPTKALSGTDCKPTGKMTELGDWEDQGCGDLM